jgi:parallel beta-helix repeat protein
MTLMSGRKEKMKRELFSGFLVISLLISMVGLAFNIHSVRAGTIIVPDNYLTIQQAVYAASPGDTIIVKSGTYTENVYIYVDHLTIKSESGSDVTTVNAANKLNVFYVAADFVKIQGFTASGGNIGIVLVNAQFCDISDNICQNNDRGVHLYNYSSNNTVKNNICSGNNVGIQLGFNCSNNILENNTCSQNRDGIQLLESSNNNILRNNTCSGNGQTGIVLVRSQENVICENFITENSQYGVQVYDSSSGNKFYHNDFVDNTVQAWYPDFTTIWDDGYPSGGNYWSDYTGVDGNSDGIGDTAYIIDVNNRDRYPLMKPWTTTPPPENQPPIARFTYGPRSPVLGQPVNFDASGSYDLDGSIVAYNWNFGDGSAGIGVTATHSYSKVGNYKATLRVTDNQGKSSSTTATMTVMQSKTDDRIELAIKWVLDWWDGPPYPPSGPHGQENYVTYCLAFVLDAYEYGAKTVVEARKDGLYQYARQVADLLGAQANKGEPPRGAFVFYDCTGTINGETKNWGHVGLSLGNGEIVHAMGQILRGNYLQVSSPGSGWSKPVYIGWTWPRLIPPIQTKGLSVLSTCPVDLLLTDPEGFNVTKESSYISAALYVEQDLDGDGSVDDCIFIPEPKTGEYNITVVPELGADPNSTYKLEVLVEGMVLCLADNVSIADISEEPYIFYSEPVVLLGDINSDNVVDIYDAILLANSYNSIPSSPNWNLNADINGDNMVDIYDAIILAGNYGKTA